MSDLKNLLLWPGKSAQTAAGCEHPAIYHMLDVAAVAEQLIEPFAIPSALRDALILLIALHDLGKINQSFRAMLQGDKAAPSFRHWEVSEVLLRHHDHLLADHLGGDRLPREALYAAISGHHGRPPTLRFPVAQAKRVRLVQADDALRFAGYGVAASAEVIAAFAALWPKARLEGLDLATAQTLSWWLAGLCTTADWLGSNTDWFEPTDEQVPLDIYLESRRKKASRAIAEAGLAEAPAKPGNLFAYGNAPGVG